MLEITLLLSAHPLQGDLSAGVQCSVVLEALPDWDKVGGEAGQATR